MQGKIEKRVSLPIPLSKTHWQEAFFTNRGSAICPYCGKEQRVRKSWAVGQRERNLHHIFTCQDCDVPFTGGAFREITEAELKAIQQERSRLAGMGGNPVRSQQRPGSGRNFSPMHRGNGK